MKCLRAALIYGEMGWQVVPVSVPTATGCSCKRGAECASPGKHPMVKWKDHGGSTDRRQIEAWWRRWPWANVAILTGADRSGLFVVDVDPGHGGDATLAALEDMHGTIPATLTARTGGLGRHLLFRHPGGGAMDTGAKQGAGDLGPGLDTRSGSPTGGGYGLIIAAPSLHKSGRRYEWVNWGTEVADVPTWILDKLRKPPPAPITPLALPTGQHGRYAEAALKAEAARVRAALVGTRNDTLNAAAFSLGQLVGAGLIEDWRAAQTLLDAAHRSGLGTGEAQQAILSGLRDGIRQPRSVTA